jgi:hypothetical protein
MLTRCTSFVTAALVVAFVLAFAPDGRAQDTVKEHSITGCLRSGSVPNSFMISNGGEDAPIKAGIVSSNADLATHLGQKVEITGTLVPAQEAEADSKAPKAFHYMKVTSVKTISATCP